MFEQSTSQRLAGVDQGRRPLDLAEGIVMTLRRTDPASAFAEMISVAADHGVTVLALARALINLVGGPASLNYEEPLNSRFGAPGSLRAKQKTGRVCLRRVYFYLILSFR